MGRKQKIVDVIIILIILSIILHFNLKDSFNDKKCLDVPSYCSHSHSVGEIRIEFTAFTVWKDEMPTHESSRRIYFRAEFKVNMNRSMMNQEVVSVREIYFFTSAVDSKMEIMNQSTFDELGNLVIHRQVEFDWVELKVVKTVAFVTIGEKSFYLGGPDSSLTVVY